MDNVCFCPLADQSVKAIFVHWRMEPFFKVPHKIHHMLLVAQKIFSELEKGEKLNKRGRATNTFQEKREIFLGKDRGVYVNKRTATTQFCSLLQEMLFGHITTSYAYFSLLFKPQLGLN